MNCVETKDQVAETGHAHNTILLVKKQAVIACVSLTNRMGIKPAISKELTRVFSFTSAQGFKEKSQ